MEPITATVSNVQPKPFGGMLESYPQRALFARTKADIVQVVETLKKANGVTEDVPIKNIQITGRTPSGEASGKFDFFQLPGKPPVYCITVSKPAAGGIAVKILRDLTALTHAPTIAYVHESAVALVKIPALANFPSILFQSQEEVDSYFASGLFGNDEKEVLFYCRQKQIYVTEKIMLSADFAKEKASRKNFRESSGDDAGSEFKEAEKKREKPIRKKEHSSNSPSNSNSKKEHSSKSEQKSKEKEELKEIASGPRESKREGKKTINKSAKAPSEDKSTGQATLLQNTGNHDTTTVKHTGAYAQAAKKGVVEDRQPASKNESTSRPRGSRQTVGETRSAKRTWILPEDDSAPPVAQVPAPAMPKATVVAGIPLSIPAPQSYPVQAAIPPVTQPGIFGFPGGFGFGQQSTAPNMTPEMWASVAQVASQMAARQTH